MKRTPKIIILIIPIFLIFGFFVWYGFQSSVSYDPVHDHDIVDSICKFYPDGTGAVHITVRNNRDYRIPVSDFFIRIEEIPIDKSEYGQNCGDFMCGWVDKNNNEINFIESRSDAILSIESIQRVVPSPINPDDNFIIEKFEPRKVYEIKILGETRRPQTTVVNC